MKDPSTPYAIGNAAVLWMALVVAGCTTTGQSSDEMKKAVSDSFLFQSAPIFYPNGVPAAAEDLPVLPSAQRAKIAQMYERTVSDVRNAHAKYATSLSTVFGRPIALAIDVHVIITNSGKPAAHIESNGDLSIDTKVAQAIYRAALLAGLDKEDTFFHARQGKPRSPKEQLEAISQFFELKRQLETAQTHGMVGDLYEASSMAFSEVRGRDSDMRKASWFSVTDIAMKSQVAQNHYYGQMRFLIAHELGHSVLSHFTRIRTISPADCGSIQALEFEADLYAAILYAVSTPELAIFEGGPMAGFGMDAGESDDPGMLGLGALSGFEDFFTYSYDFSGFMAQGGGSTGCGYPDPDLRRKAVSAPYKAIRKTQSEARWNELWEEALRKSQPAALERKKGEAPQ